MTAESSYAYNKYIPRPASISAVEQRHGQMGVVSDLNSRANW